jgi:hypothetical protein
LSTKPGQYSTFVDKSVMGRGAVDEADRLLEGSPIAVNGSSYSRPNRLAESSADDIEHLFDVLVGVALLGRGLDAALDVILEDEQRDGIDGGAECRSLLQDVDAILAPLDHPLDAAHLTLDSPQATDQSGLVAGVGMAKSPLNLALIGRLGCYLGRRRKDTYGAAGTAARRPDPLGSLQRARAARLLSVVCRHMDLLVPMIPLGSI